jgi:peptidoglycan/LPS O-acetylase OafA/YrhL
MKSRVFGLDLLRALAMLSVILAHSGYDRLFGLRHGIIAVESFFVMSGFLIGEMLIRDFRDGFNFTDLKYFWIKRWFRTLPLYYCVLILKFIFIDHSISYHIGYYFLFLQNNFFGINFLPVSWTLVLEEWFYIIMPLLFFVFFRKGIQARKFLLFVLLFIFLSNVIRLGWVLYTNRPYGAIVGNFPFRLDSFLIGVGLAAIKLFSESVYKKMARTWFFVCALSVFLGMLYFFRMDNGGNLGEDHLLWLRTIWFSLISISIALLLPFLNASVAILWVAKLKPLNFIITWISFLSYGIYLVHLDVFKLVNQFVPSISHLHPAIAISLRVFVAIAISFLLYKFIHEPFIKLRTKIVGKRING